MFGLDSTKLFIEPFNGKNFLSWKFIVETILKQRKCEIAISEPDITKIDPDVEMKAVTTISTAVAPSHISIIRTKGTAYKMWKAICDKYGLRNATTLATLRLKLNTIKMKDDEDAEDFVTRFDAILDELREAEDTFSDGEAALNLLKALPPSYKQLVTAIRASEIANNYESIKGKIVDYYLCEKLENGDTKPPHKNSEEEGPVVFHASRGRTGRNGRKSNPFRASRSQSQRGNFGGQNNFENNTSQYSQQYNHRGGRFLRGRANFRGRRFSRRGFGYQGYNNFHDSYGFNRWNNGGHYRGSYQNQWSQRGQNRFEPSQANYGCEEIESMITIVNNDICDAYSCEQEKLGNYTYVNCMVDGGCSHHMTPNFSLLIHYTEYDKARPVGTADAIAKPLEAIGEGFIPIVCNGKQVMLGPVLYVPNLRRTLLSEGEIESKGYCIVKEAGRIIIRKDGHNYFIGNRQGKLYFINVCVYSIHPEYKEMPSAFYSGMCPSEKIDSTLDYLHRKYGHLNYRSLKNMIKKGLINDKEVNISNVNLDAYNVCEVCIRSKHHRDPYPPRNQCYSRMPLELVHTDICEVKTRAIDGSKYFVTFVDDYTKFKAVYPLSKKSEFYYKFLQYENFVTTLFDRSYKIKSLRLDRGGENRDGRLIQYCKHKGINLRYTPRKESRLNGIAERLNRTVCEKARSLLFESGLPKYLWNYAVRYAVYILNRCETFGLEGWTPALVAYGNLSLKRLSFFGCVAFCHVKDPVDKMSDRSVKKFFIGVSEACYLVWDPRTKKVTTERNVLCDESRLYRNEVKKVQVELGGSESESEGETEFEVRDESEEEREKSPVVLRRSERARRPPNRFGFEQVNEIVAYMANEMEAVGSEEEMSVPRSYEEAMESSNAEKWKSAINEEFSSLRKNKVWSVVDSKIGEGKTKVGCRWVFTVKNPRSRTERFKARLVALGYMEGDENESLYAPVAKATSIRLFFALAFHNKMDISHLDICTAFLYGKIDKEIFMDIPKGHERFGDNVILKLNKSIYGLKRSPKIWNSLFDDFVTSLGFVKSRADYCLYIRKERSNKVTWLIVYVDDICIASSSPAEMNNVIKELSTRFNVKIFGFPYKFVGYNVKRSVDELILSQTEFIDNLLIKYNMFNCNSEATPAASNFLDRLSQDNSKLVNKPYRELIGSLLYLSNFSRPDIAYCVNYLSRRVNNPSNSCWQSVKRILRYLKGTREYGLHFRSDLDLPLLVGYADADFGSDPVDRKSFSGYVFEVYGNLVDWSVRKQATVALSSAEAEYVSLSSSACQGLWLFALVSEMVDYQCESLFTLYEDNKSAIYMCNDSCNIKRSKHIDVRYHFIKDLLAQRKLNVDYVPTEYQKADILTKNLCNLKLNSLCKLLRLF